MSPDPTQTFVDVVRRAEHPPGYPVAVLVVSKVVRAVTDLPLPDAMLRAAQLANALAGVLLVFPTYFLGRLLFGRAAGFAAALLVQVLPVFAHTTSDGLSEGVYLVAVTAALFLGVRAVRRPGVGPFLLTGLCVGATYLIRPEGLLVAGAVGLVAAGLAFARKWPADAALARLTALAVGLGLVAGPYAILIGRLTNKTTPRQMFSPSDASKGPIWKGQPQGRGPAAGVPVFAVWWDESTDGGSCRTWWAARAVAKEVAKTTFYVPAALGLLGVIVLRRRLPSDPGLMVLLLMAGMHAGVLVVMASSKGYVSERHTLVIGVVLCLFAAAVLDPLAVALSRLPVVGRLWAGRYASAGLLTAVVLAALPATLKPLHPHRAGHKHAGEFLAAAVQPGETVIDPFSWAEWYAGRSLYQIPADPNPAQETVRWVVMERTAHENAHTRLPRMEAAERVVNDKDNPPAVAFAWPPGPVEEAKVVVYRQAVRK